MKGDSGEEPTTTIRKDIMRKTRSTGINQYFFVVFKKPQRS